MLLNKIATRVWRLVATLVWCLLFFVYKSFFGLKPIEPFELLEPFKQTK